MAKEKIEQNWLDMIPVVKQTIGTIVHDNGLVSITIPRFNKAWMAKIFLPRNKKNEIRINFEENGTAVWNQIDGERSVREILNRLSETKENEENFNDRVVLFLQNLYQNGFIQVR